MKTLLATMTLLATTASIPQQTIDYRFDEIRRKVTLTTASQQLAVAKGQRAVSGDKVSTGFLSYALIASEHYRAKFELFGSTDVQLAGNAPGVILSLERGRLRAMFDKITGDEPRVVQTPGALLAVRGTQYEVAVDANGKTDLKVFEGTVEIRSELRPAPMLVHAGEAATFSRKDPPMSRPMPKDGNVPGGHDGHDGHDGHGDPHGGDPHGMAPPPGPQPSHGTMPPPSGKH
jgi:hypothetical protein